MNAAKPLCTSETHRLRSRFYLGKRWFSNAICNPLVGRVLSVLWRNRIPNRGCTISTDDDVVVPKVKAMIFWGLYERAELRFIHRYLRGDLDVVELGSSIGVVSAHIAKKLTSGRRLLCVEPNPHLLGLIRTNVMTNAPATSLEIVHGALNYLESGRKSVPFALEEDNTKSSLASVQSSANVVEVPVLRLGTILDRYEIGTYALVCDIEGAEVALIEHDASALQCCRQAIIELHATKHAGQIYTVQQLRGQLERLHGFRLRDQYGPVCVFERSPPDPI